MYGYLIEQDHHVAEVSMEPGVHGLAHAADLVQRRGMLIRPAEVQDLRGGARPITEDIQLGHKLGVEHVQSQRTSN